MIYHQLPITEANLVKLKEEIETQIPQYEAHFHQENFGQIILIYPDTATQAELELADSIASVHDPMSLTDAQLSEQAQQALADGATTSKKSWVLVKSFNDPPETDVKTFLQGGGTPATLDRDVPLNQTYTAWRAIFDTLSDTIKVKIMWHGYMLSEVHEFIPEPSTPTQAYKVWFNNACAQVMGYITDRAQM